MFKNISAKYKYYCGLLGGVLISAMSVAQSPDSTLPDLQYIRQGHPWLNSDQATGLQFMREGRVSLASVTTRKSDGEFRNFYQSGNSFGLNANTEAIYRLNPKVVFAGKVDYEYFNGKKMGGSVFIDPYSHAMDIDENADSTTGSKTLESYFLQGAVSAQVTSRFTLAGSVNYTAANYAKLRDLRHVNKLLDLDAQAGASYKLSSSITLGASYTYSRRIESVSFAIQGNTDRQYLSLINFGSFFGLSQLHSDQGYTGQARPLTDSRHTVAGQVGWSVAPGIELFQQFSYQLRSGYYGERGLATIVFTEHEGNRYASTTGLSIKKAGSLQYIRLTGTVDKLENFENVYTISTAPGGNSAVTYIGQNKVMNSNKTYLEGEYSHYWDIRNDQPLWSVHFLGDYTSRDQTVIRYPYYRVQQYNNYHASVTAKRSWLVNTCLLSASLGLGYGGGTGVPKTDGVYVPPSSSQIPPGSRDIYLQQEYEFFTSPQVALQPSFRVSRNVNRNVQAFINLSASLTRAWKTVYNGSDFRVIALTVGCSF
ncbi:MAG: DUF6850 family outer membrane beta-barrel protein [Chitinophagaceae bacterium]